MLKKESNNVTNIQQKADIAKKIITQKKLLGRHIDIATRLLQEIKTISFYKNISMTQRCLMGTGEKEILEYYENLIPFGLPF